MAQEIVLVQLRVPKQAYGRVLKDARQEGVSLNKYFLRCTRRSPSRQHVTTKGETNGIGIRRDDRRN